MTLIESTYTLIADPCSDRRGGTKLNEAPGDPGSGDVGGDGARGAAGSAEADEDSEGLSVRVAELSAGIRDLHEQASETQQMLAAVLEAVAVPKEVQ